MKHGVIFSALLVSSGSLLFSSAALAADKTQVVKILGGKATIELPVEFVKMPQDLLAKKYTQPGNRPQEAWYVASEEGKVTVAFSVTGSAVKEAQLPQVMEIMTKQMSAFSPSSSQVKVHGHNTGRLELNTPDAADADGYIYNLMQFSSFNGKLMIATFNATSDLEEKYKPAGQAALSSLKY
ncbi:hypothetical protein [Entomohabitans teleogrylli]|uniref:hypothetical protein n=1 Tax=Entomohabitans teleogrylli TaxID=1384589 RepID=UPI00073D5CB0|nr:hypothetical protein [Entomohabitans teleogrylli]